MKNFNIKNKDNKISQGRGNSLRNEVRGWVELGSPDPQNLSRPAERILNTESLQNPTSSSKKMLLLLKTPLCFGIGKLEIRLLYTSSISFQIFSPILIELHFKNQQ